MREIHFSDHLEQRVAEALDEVGIEFIHESEDKEQDLLVLVGRIVPE